MFFPCSDTALTPEEEQIFELLAWTLMDNDPDAHACRLKISLATSASDAMSPPWNLADELGGYSVTSAMVDAECRLALEEEAFLLGKCDEHNLVLDNRRKLVEAFRTGMSSKVGALQVKEPLA